MFHAHPVDIGLATMIEHRLGGRACDEDVLLVLYRCTTEVIPDTVEDCLNDPGVVAVIGEYVNTEGAEDTLGIDDMLGIAEVDSSVSGALRSEAAD